MPFRFAMSPTGVPSAAGTAALSATAASNTVGGQPAHAVQCQFQHLPWDVVRLIAEWLPEGARLALSKVSKATHAALDQDFVMPVRVAEAVQWAFSGTALQRVVAGIWQSPANRREALWTLASKQLERVHDQVRQGVKASLPRLGPASQPAPRQTLDEVLASAPAARADGLVRLLRANGRAVIGRLDAREWLDIVGALPPADRASALAALVLAWPDASLRLHQGRPIMDAALGMARALRQSPVAKEQDAGVALMDAVGTAISDFYYHDEDIPHRLALWDELMYDTQLLDGPARKDIMLKLANGAMTGAGNALPPQAHTDPPRWRQLIQSALNTLPPRDAADVLIATMEPCLYYDTTDEFQPLFNDILTAVGDLPDAAAQPVLSRVLRAASRMNNDQHYRLIWDAIFQASSHADATLQASLLSRLAKELPEGSRAACWHRVLDRVAALPPALQRKPLLSLVRMCQDMYEPSGPAVARLMPLVEPLDTEDRAALLREMLVRALGNEVASRRMILNAVGRLPHSHRAGPLQEAAADLLLWAAGAPNAPGQVSWPEGLRPGNAPRIAPMAQDFRFSLWPTDQKAAWSQLNELLTMLDLRQRGNLLTQLASASTRQGPQQVLWVLSQARTLPPTDRYEVAIYTEIARYVATSCPPAALPALPQALAPAVAALSPEHCASAVAWLHEACMRAGTPELFEPVRAAFQGKLPAEDHIAAIDAQDRKRKADPEWADGAGRQ